MKEDVDASTYLRRRASEQETRKIESAHNVWEMKVKQVDVEVQELTEQIPDFLPNIYRAARLVKGLERDEVDVNVCRVGKWNLPD